MSVVCQRNSKPSSKVYDAVERWVKMLLFFILRKTTGSCNDKKAADGWLRYQADNKEW